MLKIYCNKLQDNWHLFLPLCLFAYRTSVHSSTGYTPAYLTYGRELRQPSDVSQEFEQPRQSTVIDPDDYEQMTKLALQEARRVATQNVKKAFDNQKKYYDKHVTPKKFVVGEIVYIYMPSNKPGFTPKLKAQFQGPFVIKEVRLPKVLVKRCNSADSEFWAHVNRCKVLNKTPPVRETDSIEKDSLKAIIEEETSDYEDAVEVLPGLEPESKEDNSSDSSDEEDLHQIDEPQNKDEIVASETSKNDSGRADTPTPKYKLRLSPKKTQR